MEERKIKPCPFCGETPIMGGYTDANGNGFMVACGGCGATGPRWALENGTRKEWNRVVGKLREIPGRAWTESA